MYKYNGHDGFDENIILNGSSIYWVDKSEGNCQLRDKITKI